MTSGGGFGGDADTLFVDVITRLDEKSTRQVEQEIEQAGDAAGKKGGGALSNAFGGMLGSLPVMAGAAAAAVGAAVVGGVVAVANMAAEAQQNVAEFQAQLGVTAGEAERLGAVAEQVFGDNWTGSLTEAAAAVTNVRREIKDLSEKDLRQVTGATVAIAETFEEEQQRVAAAVQSVMQATGVSAQEATDFIARGFQKGLNSSGDFLDTLTEYAPQFEKAKIGGGELFSLLETGAAKGALGTDKIADAFKEFGLTVIDVSDDSKGIYEELNLNQEKLVKGINDGSITQAQAFETVTNALAKVKGQADRTRIGAAIFGGAGEDFANGLTQLDLTKTSMKDLEGGVDSVNTRYNSFRDVFQGVWRQVQVALLPVGKELLGIANEAMPAVKSALAQVTPVVTTVVRFLIDGFRQGRQVAGQFATEFGPQIERALVTFRPVLQAIGPLFASTFTLIKTLWETVLRPVLTAIAPLITGTVATIGNALSLVVSVATGVVNAVSALLRGDLAGAVKAMQGIFEAGATFVVRQFRTMGSTLLGLIKNLAPQMAGAAGDIIRGLIRGIENGAGAAVQAARNLAGGIIKGIKDRLRIQSPSRETEDLGVWAHQGFTQGLWKGVPEVQRAAAGLSKAALDELAKARAELEKGIAYDAWKAGLTDLNDEQLRSAAAAARAAGEQQKYHDVLDVIRQRASEATDELNRLTDAQINAANSRYRDTQGATDNAYRLTYGAGDEGLIKSLAATTGLSVKAIRADVEGALNDAKRFAPEAAAVIERVWADELTHRREVAAQEKSVMDEQLVNARAYADELRRILAGGIDSDAEARGLITPEALAAMQAELIALDRPLDSMVAWLEDVAQGSDAAAVAAQGWLDTYAASLELLPRVGQTAEELAADVQASADQTAEAWDDTNITIDSLNAQIAELRAQGRDPMTSGFLDYLDGIIERGGPAADAAQQVRDGLVSWSEAAKTNAAERVRVAEEVARIEVEGAKLVIDAQRELNELITGETLPAWEKRAQALEQQAQVDETHREQLYELAAALRAAGKAADENAAKLNVTLKIGGIDTGLKQLDLYKSAISGIADVMVDAFSNIVAGTSQGVDDVLKNMAKMALGIVKQVGVALIAYGAQAAAAALIGAATFNPVQIAAALAAGVALAALAAGLEARLGQSTGAAGSIPAGSAPASAPAYSPATTAQQNTLIQIPASQVTVGAAPAWEARFGGHVDRFGQVIDRVIQQARMPTLPPSGGGGGGTPPVTPLLILTP